MSVIINPGSGPVARATYEHAKVNIEVFRDEVGAHSWEGGPNETSGDGRWAFRLRRHGFDRTVTVDMPGLPIDRVRYVGDPAQDIWDFPRLYVDGSSWVWMYAASVCWRAEDE